jgi:hypothetical protein
MIAPITYDLTGPVLDLDLKHLACSERVAPMVQFECVMCVSEHSPWRGAIFTKSKLEKTDRAARGRWQKR